MSASYSDIRRYSIEPEVLSQATVEIIRDLGWKVVYQSDYNLIAEAQTGLKDEDDIVTVHIQEIGSVLITSENRRQYYDYGRNQKRVMDFLEQMDNRMIKKEAASIS